MTTKTILNLSLLTAISQMDTAARIPALRSVVHSSMAKCIGGIRQDLRERQRTERQDPADAGLNELDQANARDANNRYSDSDEPDVTYVADEAAKAMGFDPSIPAIKQASLWHAVYDYALAELQTLTSNRFEQPLNVDAMLDFMIKNAQSLDPALAKAVADVCNTDVKTIEKLNELQALREKEQLKEARDEIIATFNSFGENGYEDALENIPAFFQHQLGVKVYEGLLKAKDAVIARVLRSRRMADLGSTTIIDGAAKDIRAWTEQFASTHRDDIDAAMAAGRTVRTADDVALA